MESEVIAAIIAVGGVILSVIISFLVSHLTLRFNYHQLYADTVSKNRMEWINVWRENISKFLARAELLNRYSCTYALQNLQDNFLYRCEQEIYEARAMIVSRLNMTEELHMSMLTAINTLDYRVDSATFVAQREYILELAREILKPEWERVKREAKGKKH